MAHSPRPRASLRGASALQKRRCPRAVFLPCSVVAVVGRGGNPVFAGAGAFPAMRGMFKRPSAALPAGGEPSEVAFFCGAAPAFRRLRRATFFCPGAERGQPGNFTPGCLAMALRRAACPSFPAEDFRAGGPRTRRRRAGRQRSSAQVVRGRFVTDGQPRLRRGTGRSALKLPGGCSALP